MKEANDVGSQITIDSLYGAQKLVHCPLHVEVTNVGVMLTNTWHTVSS
jgi:hypothetical protein